MLGLYDWLTERGHTRFWQICGLHTRKAIILMVLLTLLLATSLMEYYFTEKLHIPYPTLLHGLLFLVKLATFAVLGFGLYAESWTLIVPFVILEVGRIALWSVYGLYYLFRYVQNKIKGIGGDLTMDSIVVPGAPSYGLGSTYGNRNSNSFLMKVFGHIIIIITIRTIILWIAVSIMRIFHARTSPYVKGETTLPAPAHNVIILKQPVEEAIYGRKKTSR